MLTYTDLHNHIIVAEKLHSDIERIKFINYFCKWLAIFLILFALYPYFPLYIELILALLALVIYCGRYANIYCLERKINHLNTLIVRINDLKGITNFSDLEKSLFEMRMSHIGFG